MNDFLLQNPQARRVIKSLGLPIPLPQQLQRANQPWQERPLHDHTIVFGGADESALAPVIATALTRAGANVFVRSDAAVQAFGEAGEAYGRPATKINGQADSLKLDALVFDASGITSPSQLRSVYDFFHPWVKRLKRCGRLLLLARPHGDSDTAAAAAAQRALDGFVRSISKEIGRKGSTAQLLTVAAGAEDRLEATLRWLLSARSAFVAGQPIAIDNTAQWPLQTPTTRVLEGKTALITGAARGIGKATAKLFADEGAKVVCLDRPADDGPLSQVARDVGGSVLLCDVSADDAADKICDGLQQGVDIVVHNAGVTRDKTLARMKPERWDQAIDINLSAVTHISEQLVARGLLRDHGRLVCLSSVAGIAGNMGQTNYAASKAGIIGLVEHLAPRLGERGITVNAVAPGFIETRLTAAIPVVIREVGRRLSALGQGGQPQDVAELITFLASPGAAGISGQIVRVCGGAFIGA